MRAGPATMVDCFIGNKLWTLRLLKDYKVPDEPTPVKVITGLYSSVTFI